MDLAPSRPLSWPRAVYFDAVGTLLRPHPPVGEAYAQLALRHGIRLQPEEILHRFRSAFAREEEKDRNLGWITSEAREYARWKTIVAEVFQEQAEPTALFDDLYRYFARPDAWACYPDAADCISWLQAHGCSLGIASNFDARLRGLVAGIPALRPCTSLVISSEVGWRKPARQFFDRVLELAGLPPGDVLLVGDDRVNDYDGGKAAGLQVVLLERSGRVVPPATIASLAELPQLLLATRSETAR